MLATIVLYGKPGCHLCEDARDVLLVALGHYDFVIEEKNILEDDDLFNEYVEDIPVVTIDGELFCRYKVRLELLEAKLDTLTERRKL
jgi:hypothetical protein